MQYIYQYKELLNILVQYLYQYKQLLNIVHELVYILSYLVKGAVLSLRSQPNIKGSLRQRLVYTTCNKRIY